MEDYLVIWSINIDAESPEDAAREVLSIMRDKYSDALCFTVVDGDGNETLVDLGDT